MGDRVAAHEFGNWLCHAEDSSKCAVFIYIFSRFRKLSIYLASSMYRVHTIERQRTSSARDFGRAAGDHDLKDSFESSVLRRVVHASDTEE